MDRALLGDWTLTSPAFFSVIHMLVQRSSFVWRGGEPTKAVCVAGGHETLSYCRAGCSLLWTEGLPAAAGHHTNGKRSGHGCANRERANHAGA